MYDTARIALEQLTDAVALEQVAVEVLRARYPDLRLSGPSGDTGNDAFSRKLFDTHNQVVLLVSRQRTWGAKLTSELDKIKATPRADRPLRAIYVSTQSIQEQHQKRYVNRAKRLGVALEFFAIDELVFELGTDALRPVAERLLNVRPVSPSPLLTVQSYLAGFGATVPGMTAPLIGDDHTRREILHALQDAATSNRRIVVVEGSGGSGKTRLSLEAAAEAGAVLIAPPSVRLDTAAFEHITLNDIVTVVVDDANRSPDLTGIAAMLNDARFRNVRVLFTCRQTATAAVLYDSGLDTWAAEPILVPLMTSSDIEQIVRSHGIHDATLTATVIQIADGSPLIAQAVCEEAVRQGRLAWGDVADLLERRFQSATLRTQDDAVGAAAVALAIRGTARDTAEIIALAPAVPQLPTAAADIERALALLADLGIATFSNDELGNRQYSLTPHVTAPVILARSLRHGERVTSNPRAALRILGQETLIDRSVADAESVGPTRSGDTTVGPLGIPALADEGPYRLAGLATALETFAVAAVRLDDHDLAQLLGRAVSELLPESPTVGAWVTVLILAAPVARAAPTLLNDLAAAIERAWPPRPDREQMLWPGTTAEQAHRSELGRLIGQLCSLVDASGAANPTASVRLLLAGTQPLIDDLDSSTIGRVGTSLRNLANSGRGNTEGMDTRRGVVVAAAADWLHQHRPDKTATSRSGWARVGVAAVEALLKPFDESTRSGFADGSQVVQFRSQVLPDTPATYESITACLDALREIVDHLDPADPAVLGVLKRLVDLPYELRATEARGMPLNTGPVPAYIGTMTTDTAAGIERIFAGRWTDLPDQVRHYAAAQAVRRGGIRGKYRTLKQRAAAGDPIAALAHTDVALRDLLVLVPVDIDENAVLDDTATSRRHQRARLKAARDLAERLTWREALALLRRSAGLEDFWDGRPPRAEFVDAVAERISNDDCRSLLHELRSTTVGVPREDVLIESLVRHHGQVALNDLSRHADNERGAQLLLWAFPAAEDADKAQIVDNVMAVILRGAEPATATTRHRPDTTRSSAAAAPRTRPQQPQEQGVLHGLSRVAVRLWRGPTATAPPQPTSGDEAAAAAEMSTPTADAAQVRPTPLAHYLVDQLFRSDWDQRTDRLLDFGMRGPAALTPAVLRNITMTDRIPDRWPPLTEHQWQGVVAVLERRLLADDDLVPDLYSDYDTAIAVQSLAVHVPHDLARLLVERLTAEPDTRLHWPFEWRGVLADLTSDQRIPLTAEFTRLIDTSGPLDDLAQYEVDIALGYIGAGTDDWQTRLLDKASGNSDDVTSVVTTISPMWRHPAWPVIVSKLLTHGLDSDNTERLVDAIDMRSFGDDDEDRIHARHEVLASLAPADDPAVAAFVSRAQRRIADTVRQFRSRDGR